MRTQLGFLFFLLLGCGANFSTKKKKKPALLCNEKKIQLFVVVQKYVSLYPNIAYIVYSIVYIGSGEGNDVFNFQKGKSARETIGWVFMTQS